MAISAEAERIRLAVYRGFAQTGRVPTRREMPAAYGIDDAALEGVLDELAAARHIVLAGGEIELAHPFASRSFGFSVMGPQTLWWGGCAWDAFAIPHLVPDAPEVLVATTCPACGTAHAWTVGREAPPRGDQVAHFLVPAHDIWPDAAHACENQLLFCDERCVSRWLDRTGAERGYVLTLDTLWRLAASWYEGRLDTPYERRDPASAAGYFASVGLSGPFWGLPDRSMNRTS
ncbi:alkylmercury lyase family protein [Herbiconiux daphne]|uniref:Alkylmercury lyase family protein n=1 Tax=Herbiconiux daphne TaxID=2970914 RepID=A0ABT2H5K7_9MICO|nr:alkylmercury lyase family protein [Herbiconiux daphne]MCS5735232.1 alkylmercury lyase family protein [Herbiconiux daphne]